MTTASDRRAIAEEIYNRVLGSKTGRLRDTTIRDFEPNAVALAVATKIKNDAKRLNVEARTGSSGGGTKKSKTKDKLTPEEAKAKTKQLLSKNKITSGEHVGFWEQVGSGVGAFTNFISRPLATTAGALKHTEQALNKGEPIWSVLDDALYGARRGITGKEHTGYGDVIAEQRRGPASGKYHDPISGLVARVIGANPARGTTPAPPLSFHEEAQAARRANPPKETGKKAGLFSGIESFIKSPFAQTAVDSEGGLVGDVVLDPLTWGSFGAETAVKAGGKAGVEGISEVAKNAGRDAVTNLGKSHIGEAVADDIDNIVKNITREVGSGPNANKVLGNKELRSTIGHMAGQAARERAATMPVKVGFNNWSPVESLDRFFQSVRNGNPWKARYLNRFRTNDALFEEGYKAYTESRFAGNSVDDAIADGRIAIDRLLQSDADEVAKNVTKSLNENLQRQIKLKFAGQNVATVPGLGKLSERAAAYTEDKAVGRIMFGMSHAKQNPGVAGVISGKTHSQIAHEAAQFGERLNEINNVLQPGEVETLTHMLEGTIVGPAHLQPIKAELRTILDEMFQESVDKGVRKATEYVPNYAPQNLKSLSKKTNEWNEARKAALKAGDDISQYSTEAAAKAGLKPERNALKNIMTHKARELQRSAPQRLAKMLGESYAMKMTMPIDPATKDKFLLDRGLQELSPNQIPEELAATLGKSDMAVMDKDLYQIIERYKEMVKPGSWENRDLIRIYDFLLGKFKKMATIYRPGFHFKNLISDAFIGSMDGITFRDYKKVWGVLDGKSGKMADAAIGNHTWQELGDEFQHNLSSGFVGSEFGSSKYKKTIAKRVQDISEKREDWGRFAHFYGAMKDEYPKALQRGLNPEKAWKQAVDTSIYRVNKYKFDYGALTKGEAKVAKRIVPFYTFSRKIIPLLAESAFISPRNLSIAAKIIGEGKERMPEDTPDWMKAAGFFPFMGSKSNPWGINLNQMLPLSNAADIGENPLASISPLAQIPMDLQSGHDIFSHKKITGDNPLAQLFDSLKNKLPPVQAYRQLTPDDKVNEDTGEVSVVPYLQRAASMLGIPLRKITPAQADQQLKSMVDNLAGKAAKLDKEVADPNGYSVRYSPRQDGVTLRLIDVATGEVLGDYDLLSELEADLRKLINRG